MKSLTAFNITTIDNPHIDVSHLVKIEFSGLTLYLCDRIWGDAGAECVFNGQLYEPMILSVQPIGCGTINPVTLDVAPCDFNIVIDNSRPMGGADSFAELFATYDPHYATVTISEIFEGASAAGDEIKLAKGEIEDLQDMTVDQITIVCSGYELSIANKFAYDVVEVSTYPSADPDDVGKMLPQAYGRAQRVPFMAVDAGGFTHLSEDLDSSETTIDITDSDKLASSGTVQIGAEQITYTGNTGNQLTGCTRGANGTTATTHSTGDGIGQVQTDYFYIIGHAVKSIDTVYVAGVRIDAANYTAYTGQSGDEHASYPGKACIKFTAEPFLYRQVGLDVNDTIAVNDTIDVADTIGVSDTISYASAAANKEVYPTGYTGNVNTSNPANAYDGNADSYADIYNAGFAAYCTFTFPSTNYGTISNQYIWLLIQTGGGGAISIQEDDGTQIGTIAASAGKGWYRFTNPETNWNEGVRVVCAAGEQALVYEVKKVVEYAPTLTKSGSASKTGSATKTGAATKSGTVTLTGNSVADIVVGGRVSADLQGFQDDGAGTYTGTPSALIEQPNHILKHLIIDRCGLTASEIDSTTYSAAGTFYAANSFRLAPVVLQKPSVRALINRIAFQARSIGFWVAGVHHLVHLPDSDSTDKTIRDHMVDQSQVQVRYTERVQIQNEMSARYKHHWDGYISDEEADRSVVSAENAASQAKYGVLQKETLSWPYIIDAAVAQDVIDWLVGLLANPRLDIFFPGGFFLREIERGDVVQFDFTIMEGQIYIGAACVFADRTGAVVFGQRPGECVWFKTKTTAPDANALETALLGLVSDTDQFRVLDNKYLPAGQQLRMIKM